MGLLQNPKRVLSRLYRQFQHATAETLTGYDNPELLEVIFQKTKLFRPKERWTELDGAKTVLDFGGGCGIHYLMAQSPDVRWAVVETPAMVERGAEIARDNLRFFTATSEAAAWLGEVDAMHSNSALQYVAEPENVLRELCSLGANTMLWKRIAISDKFETDTQSSFLIDNGPGTLKGLKNKSVTYARTRIPESLFLACHDRYRVETHRTYLADHRRIDDFRFALG